MKNILFAITIFCISDASFGQSSTLDTAKIAKYTQYGSSYPRWQVREVFLPPALSDTPTIAAANRKYWKGAFMLRMAVGDTSHYFHNGLKWTQLSSGGGPHTHSTGDIISGQFGTARLGSGTANTTTYLRGDGQWIVPSFVTLSQMLDSISRLSINAGYGLKYGADSSTFIVDSLLILTEYDRTKLKDSLGAAAFPVIGGTISGIGGAGYIGFKSQTIRPPTPPTGEIREFVDSLNQRAYLNSAGKTRSFNYRANPNDAVYYYQNKGTGYTVGDSLDIAKNTDSLTSHNTRINANTANIGANSASIALKLNIADFIVRETPSGTVNGSNTVFTLAFTPVAGKESVYLNGQEIYPPNDYTISSNTITFLTAPPTGSKVRVTYPK